jgi:hypothetical protein
MTMTRSNSIMLVGLGAVLLIAAHGVVVWGGVTLSTKTGEWLPWIGGGALAFAMYHVVQAFGVYHVVRHIRGRDYSSSHRSSGHTDGRGEVERGPHDGVLVNLGHGLVELTVIEADTASRLRLFLYDKRKRARPVPRNATVTIEIVRQGDTRQTFAFHATRGYFESTTPVPEPHEFKAVVRVSHGSRTHTHEIDFSPSRSGAPGLSVTQSSVRRAASEAHRTDIGEETS